MERELPLEKLASQQQKLSKIREERQHVYDAIGTGNIKPVISERKTEYHGDLQIIRTRAKLRININNLQGAIDAINQTIEGQLDIYAQQYLNQVSSMQARLDEMRKWTKLAGEDPLADRILAKNETEYRVFAAKPGQDPLLKKGIDLLRQKGQEKTEEPKSSDAEPDERKSELEKAKEEIILDGQPIKGARGKITLIILRELITTLNFGADRIKDVELTHELYGEVTPETRRTTQIQISHVAKKYLTDRGYRVSSVGRISVGTEFPGLGLNYFLEKIQPQSPTVPAATTETPSIEPPAGVKVDELAELEKAREALAEIERIRSEGLEKGQDYVSEEALEEARKAVAELEGKEKPLPNIIFDKDAKTLTVNGKGPFKLSTRDTVFLGYLYDRPNEHIPSRDLQDAFSKAGLKSAVGVTAFDIEKKIGEKIFERIGHTTSAKWSLPRKVEIKEIVEKEEPAFPEKRPEQIIQITFNPDNNMITKDGEQISIGEFLGAIVKYLYENQDRDVDSSVIFQVLKDAGSKLNDKNNVTPYINSQIRRKLGNIGDLIQITNKGRINHYALSPNFSVTMEKPIQLQDEPEKHPEPKEDLEKKRDDLTTYIEQLQTRISSIEEKIISGGLSEISNPMLEALRKAMDEKRAELKQMEELLKSLPPKSPSGEIIDVPYQRPPETIRTADETNLLILITGELSEHERLWFERIQSGLNAHQNPRRYESMRGGGRRKFKPYDSAELKQLFASAYRKMDEDSQIPLRRKEWNEKDESTWENINTLIQKIGEGDTRRFFQRVNGLIDRAVNEYYQLHTTVKEGEGWVV